MKQILIPQLPDETIRRFVSGVEKNLVIQICEISDDGSEFSWIETEKVKFENVGKKSKVKIPTQLKLDQDTVPKGCEREVCEVIRDMCSDLYSSDTVDRLVEMFRRYARGKREDLSTSWVLAPTIFRMAVEIYRLNKDLNRLHEINKKIFEGDEKI
jgi:hypothetical protein